MPKKTQRPRPNRASRVVAAATAVPVRRCWSSKFPDDLLAVICRMLDSPRSRARFVAVCRSWRAAARAAPPVALPWLQLSPWSSDDTTKHLYCPEDGSIVRVPLPGKRALVGCYDGGWIATFAPASLKIVNISSGAKVRLGQRQERLVCGDHVRDLILKIYGFSEILKIVFSEPPTSPGCILATVVNHKSIGHCIGLCRIGCPSNGWTIQRCHSRTFVDIAFCNNELYGLTENAREIIKFEIGVNEDGAPVVIAQNKLAMESFDDSLCVKSSRENVNYIFDLHGKLAMARWTYWSQNLPPFFKVFELADIQASELTMVYKHKWVEVTNLGNHALFLGLTFSKAVHVPAKGRGGVERNHIYFSHHHRLISGHTSNARYAKFASILNERGYQEYYMEKDRKRGNTADEVERIRSVGYFTLVGYCTGGIDNHSGVWVLPPDI